MKKTIALLNLISVILLIAWNAYANTGNYNGTSVGDLSDIYTNLFTPASYAFSIWSIIFLMLIVYSINGVYYAFAKAESQPPNHNKLNDVQSTFPWFLIANLFCGLWVMFWLDQSVVVSVICMLILLVSLLICVHKLEIGIGKAVLKQQFLSWLPISLYAGWISVATIANIAAWLNHDYHIDTTTQVDVTIAMIVVAFLVNCAMVMYRKMYAFALVGVWALAAIAVRFNTPLDGLSKMATNQIAITSLTCASILVVVILVRMYRSQSIKASN